MGEKWRRKERNQNEGIGEGSNVMSEGFMSRRDDETDATGEINKKRRGNIVNVKNESER